MLLAIDCGNTNVVFAVFDGEELRGQWRAATKTDRTADEYGVWLTQLLEREDLKALDVTDAIVASVVPGKNFDLRKLCENYFYCKPKFIGDADLDLGATARVDNPREVGADRVVNAVAAHAAYKGPLIVIGITDELRFAVEVHR